MDRLTSPIGMLAGFIGAAVLAQGCIGTCKNYCDGFDPKVESDHYAVEVYDEAAVGHFATELSEAEITDEQVILHYVDLDGAPQEVVWDIVDVEQPG